MNPNAKDNLQPPWKPGESGNPKGKPLGAKSLTGALRKFLEFKIRTDHPLTKKTNVEMTVAERLMLAVIVKGANGDVPALREIWDRIEGKVAQPLSGPNGSPLLIESTQNVEAVTDEVGEQLLKKLDDILRASKRT